MANPILRRKKSAKPRGRFFLPATFITFCVACTEKHEPVEIVFAGVWQGQPISCGNDETALTDLRFFVSDIVLLDADGGEYPLRLTPDGRWQQSGVALVDLENGEGSCTNGTAEMNAIVVGTARDSEFDAVRFTIGVPFALNHANPMLAEPPLDDSAMHWYWRSGYKFLRSGISNSGDGFWMHLGSTGCEGSVRSISGCRFPNRVTVEIADFSPATDRIAVDLSALFEAVNLDDGDRSNCSSGLAETACAAPFAALGLEFAENSNKRPQTVFRAYR